MFFHIMFFLLAFVYSVILIVRNVPTEVRHLRVHYRIEFFFRDENVLVNENSFSIYYFGDLRLYRFNYPFDSVGSGRSLNPVYRPYYFIFYKGDKRGYYMDPVNAGRNRMLNVDSVMRKSALQEFNWGQVSHLRSVSSFDSTTGVLEDVYAASPGDTIRDTMLFYYSDRFQGFDFTFSRMLDSLKKMKLFRIVLKNGSFYNENLQKQFPKRESYFMMEAGKEKNPEEVKVYIRHYRKMKRRFSINGSDQ